MARRTKTGTAHRRFVAVLTAGIAATMLVVGGVTMTHRGQPARAGADLATPENFAFWYQPITPTTDLTSLGHPRVVVHFDPTNAAATERLAVNRIHAQTGAAAYRYVQLYYLPARRRLMSMRIGRHPRSAFCTSGSTPAYDSVVKPTSERWMFVDANERSVVTSFKRFLARVKSWGWNGIFLDLAHRAFTQDFWDRSSTCEHDPVVPGRASADAYAALVPIARSMGLQVMVNAGAPSGVPLPLRPDPADPACRAARWPDCRGLDDVARSATWILHEGASNEWTGRHWNATVRALAADEAASKRSDRAPTVAMGVYRGPAADRVAHTVFQWAMMKLFDLPAAFGTGTDRCGDPPNVPLDPACNRGGIAPAALVDSTLGPPIDQAPLTRACEPGRTRCLWIRRYRDAMVVVNNASESLTVDHLALADAPGCRTVSDVMTGTPYAAGHCVSTIAVNIPALHAAVLRYGTGA